MDQVRMIDIEDTTHRTAALDIEDKRAFGMVGNHGYCRHNL